jgi:integrase
MPFKVAGATRQRIVLTARGIEALRAEDIAYRVPDTRTVGLAVRVAPNGTKTWDLAFRIRGTGKVKRLSLGRTTDLVLEAARARATELTSAARTGRDLLAEEEADRAAEAARVMVSSVIESYVRRRVAGQLRTAKEIESRLRRALSSLASRPACEIRRRDIRALLDEVADAGYLREAEKRRQSIGAMFRWAVSQDLIDSNPADGLASYGTSPPRDRVLAPDEIRVLWPWLCNPDEPDSPTDILRLELLLGARCGEIGGMQVGEIDQGSWLWTLPSSRSKNKRPRVTPLVGIAREIVERRLAMTHQEALFATERGSPFTSSNVGSFLLNRADRLPIEKFTTHDLRRTVATQLVEMGVALDVVAAVIGHEAGGRDTRTLVRHYVRTSLVERKRTVLSSWDQRLRDIVSGEFSPTSKVHELAAA